jgi:hypothetical protein
MTATGPIETSFEVAKNWKYVQEIIVGQERNLILRNREAPQQKMNKGHTLQEGWQSIRVVISRDAFTLL